MARALSPAFFDLGDFCHGLPFSIILYGIGPTDPLTYALVLGGIAPVAFMARLAPASARFP